MEDKNELINKKKVKIEDIYMLILITLTMRYFQFKLLRLSTDSIALTTKIITIYVITAIILLISYFIIINNSLIKKYIVCACVFGVMFIIFSPLLHGIDEGAHFYKIYSYFSSSNEVPEWIYNVSNEKTTFGIFEYIGKDIFDTKTISSEVYRGANLYTFVSYIPYIISVFITAVLLKLKGIYIIILARIAGFITYLLIELLTLK